MSKPGFHSISTFIIMFQGQSNSIFNKHSLALLPCYVSSSNMLRVIKHIDFTPLKVDYVRKSKLTH